MNVRDRILAIEEVLAELCDQHGIAWPPSGRDEGRDDPEYWAELQAELDEMEQNDPAVAKAARKFDARRAEVLAEKPSEPKCKTCGDSGIKVTPHCNICTRAQQAKCDDPSCKVHDRLEPCPKHGGRP